MSQVKNIAKGFLTASTFIWLFSCTLLYQEVDIWVGVTVFLFLAVPFTASAIESLITLEKTKTTQEKIKLVKSVLMYLQGFGIAAWFFAVVANALSLSVGSILQVYPLNWLLYKLASLVFFVPAMFIVNYLLYKVKSKASFYGSIVITGISLVFGFIIIYFGSFDFRIPLASTRINTMIIVILSVIYTALSSANILALMRLRKR